MLVAVSRRRDRPVLYPAGIAAVNPLDRFQGLIHKSWGLTEEDARELLAIAVAQDRVIRYLAAQLGPDGRIGR